MRYYPLILILLIACSDQSTVSTPIDVVRVAPEIGAVAPTFTGTDPDGRTVALRDHRGSVVMLDFWATWCGPCIVDLPNLKARWERFRGEDFQIIGISLDSDLGSWRTFLDEQQIDWLNVADGRYWDSETARLYDVSAIPATFVIGRDGTVRAINARGAALDSAIATALRQ